MQRSYVVLAPSRPQALTFPCIRLDPIVHYMQSPYGPAVAGRLSQMGRAGLQGFRWISEVAAVKSTESFSTVGFRIHSSWQRPSKAQLDAFGSASSAQVADAMLRFGAMDCGVRPVWRSKRVAGPAITVWCRSADNLMMHKALSLVEPGDVLVVNTQGNMTNAGFGELMASTAVRCGVAAVIVDGVVRDVDALERLQMPTYARGLNPTGCDKDGPGEIGGVVACGGVAVAAGDVIIADEDGVTVVPLADVDTIAGLAQAAVEREAKRLDEIDRGVHFRPEIDEALRRRGVIP